MSKTVKLTLEQAEAVEWAIGPMADYWCSGHGAHERGVGVFYEESVLPELRQHIGARGKPLATSRILVLSTRDDVNDDLLYRLEEQLPDMERQADESSKGTVSAALNAARRIRHAIKHQ